MKNIKLIAEENLIRLDKYISDNVEDISRTYIQKLISDKCILVNGKKTKASYKIELGDIIDINIPEEEELKLLPENLNLNIIFENDQYAVISKPQDMVVHPGVGNKSNTLVNGLIYEFDRLSDLNGDIRPGIVHRLDKDTSGLLVIAKNNHIHEKLSEQFKNRSVERKYIALVHGIMSNDNGVINEPIGRHPIDRKKMAVVYENSKEAITKYKVLERFNDYTLVELSLETGRTHQIRVHLSYLNYPVVGDPVYSRGKNEFKLDKQMLHSYKIGFKDPETGDNLFYEDDLPEYFSQIVSRLRKRRDG